MSIELEAPEVEVEDLPTEDDTREVPQQRYAISSYGADYPVDSLVKRMRDGSIYVPEFQRGFVWDLKDGSRFVESLVLGLPVPSIFLSKEADSGKLLVVDGQQRLQSLRYFYDGVWGPTKKEFSLKGVQAELAGKTYRSLQDEDRRRLDDAILHATAFKQDEPTADESSVYEVFYRLNSGGKILTPQEVRSAVHHAGRMRGLLEELNGQSSWRYIYGPEDPRMRDRELILRFLALLFEGGTYKRPMVNFLNSFMGKNKAIEPDVERRMVESFVSSIDLIREEVGARAFRPVRALNAAVFDSVMVATARRLRQGPILSPGSYREAYDALLANQSFLNACGRGTASEERVRTRLKLADEAFSTLP